MALYPEMVQRFATKSRLMRHMATIQWGSIISGILYFQSALADGLPHLVSQAGEEANFHVSIARI